MTRTGARFVSLAQVEASFHGRPLPANAVALTFADNYRGFLTYAYPVLKARRIPVAMFVHTGFVGSKIGRPKMTWPELQRLDREGICTVASQTVTHRDLDKLTDSEMQKELLDSKRDLERHLGHAVRYLAYPNGSFDARCEAAAQRAGYALACSEIQTPIGHDPYRVERYVHTKWHQALRDARLTTK
jgi:peptidoglycan/xylan/chitin deacetylase (PgdA/CDA1 family)